MSEDQVGYRADVDGLRAIAVLSVVVFHAFPNYLPGGFVGVDVFFIISGYLISGILLRSLHLGRFSYLDFYVRRIRRIFPALIAVLTAALVAGWFLLLPDEYKDLGKQIMAGAGFSSNLLLWRDAGFFGYFDVSAQINPLLHLWSLGIEEQFYLTWPLILAFLYRRSTHLSWTMAVLLLLSFVLNVLLTPHLPVAAFYCPLSRFWELLMGAALVYAVLLRGDGLRLSVWQKELIAWSGLGLLTLSVWLLTQKSAFPGWWALLPSLGALGLIAARDAWLNRRVLSNRVLVFVGLISYPLYLWHWVLLAMVRARVPLDGGEAPRAERVGAVALSLLLAWLTYELIEKPIRFGRRKAWQPAALLGLMLVVGFLGAAAYFSDGGAFRIPPALRPWVAIDFPRLRDRNTALYRGGRCFLGLEQRFKSLATECVEPSSAGKPALVLWGDSHAASLYPGLKAAQQHGAAFTLDQFTTAACPPVDAALYDTLEQRCRSFDTAALDKIVSMRPDVVLIEGDWWLYYTQGTGHNTDFIPALQSAIQKLEAAGVGRVVVFGNLPVWNLTQLKIMERLWLASGTLPARTDDYFARDSIAADSLVEQAAANTGAIFISPIREFCNASGCLLSVTPNALVPVAWDSAHLTPEASERLIDSAVGRIFEHPLQGATQRLPPIS